MCTKDESIRDNHGPESIEVVHETFAVAELHTRSTATERPDEVEDTMESIPAQENDNSTRKQVNLFFNANEVVMPSHSESFFENTPNTQVRKVWLSIKVALRAGGKKEREERYPRS